MLRARVGGDRDLAWSTPVADPGARVGLARRPLHHDEGTMISTSIQDALSEQLNHEFYSAYLYLAMSAYCSNADFNGAASWLEMQYEEEVQHATKIYRYLIEHGSTGLSMAFDLPTQLGRDSDEPICEGEVGRTGVPIDTIEDMRICFEEIPLSDVSTSMTINAPAAVLLPEAAGRLAADSIHDYLTWGW